MQEKELPAIPVQQEMEKAEDCDCRILVALFLCTNWELLMALILLPPPL